MKRGALVIQVIKNLGVEFKISLDNLEFKKMLVYKSREILQAVFFLPYLDGLPVNMCYTKMLYTLY
jgi:hypothetical protein